MDLCWVWSWSLSLDLGDERRKKRKREKKREKRRWPYLSTSILHVLVLRHKAGSPNPPAGLHWGTVSAVFCTTSPSCSSCVHTSQCPTVLLAMPVVSGTWVLLMQGAGACLGLASCQSLKRWFNCANGIPSWTPNWSSCQSLQIWVLHDLLHLQMAYVHSPMQVKI